MPVSVLKSYIYIYNLHTYIHAHIHVTSRVDTVPPVWCWFAWERQPPQQGQKSHPGVDPGLSLPSDCFWINYQLLVRINSWSTIMLIHYQFRWFFFISALSGFDTGESLPALPMPNLCACEGIHEALVDDEIKGIRWQRRGLGHEQLNRGLPATAQCYGIREYKGLLIIEHYEGGWLVTTVNATEIHGLHDGITRTSAWPGAVHCTVSWGAPWPSTMTGISLESTIARPNSD